MTTYLDKLNEIDRLISAAKFVSAKAILNEIASQDAEPKDSGGLYWRKLLIETASKNNRELLSRGKLLETYREYDNAIEYANDVEKPVYQSVAQKKRDLRQAIKHVLEAQERGQKRSAGVDELLDTYKREYDAIAQNANDKLTQLGTVEKEIRDISNAQKIALSEHRNTVDDVSLKVKNSHNEEKEITPDQKEALCKELDNLLALSAGEIRQAQEKTSDKQYFDLRERQNNIAKDIKRDITCLSELKQKIEDAVAKAKKISNEYADIYSSLAEGNYFPAKRAISMQRFDELVEKELD